MHSEPFRLKLRQLPLPVKLVLSVFLLAVGLGYFSAMVQLHMQHSDRDGSPLPTPDAVIPRFSKFQKFDGKFPVSKIESLITGDKYSGWGKSNMTQAFFNKSAGWDKDVKKHGQAKLEIEREGERLAIVKWINSPGEVRKKSYDEDKFPVPEELKTQVITEDFFDAEAKAFKVKSILDERCMRCHNEQKPNFENYGQLEPLITAPPPEKFQSGGQEWVRSSKTVSLEGLTQSTHAHLLSFAVLFALTGLIFAFSSYPNWLRCTLGPIVLIAQVADISCWWLARLDLPYGPMFALAIMGTGAVVGLGLALQIVLSLLNLYGTKGQAVLVVLFLIGAAGFGVLYTQAIQPGLEAQKAAAGK